MSEQCRVEVPIAFKWVIDQMLKWKEDNKSGEVTYIFKSGGICGRTSMLYKCDCGKKVGEYEQPERVN